MAVNLTNREGFSTEVTNSPKTSMFQTPLRSRTFVVEGALFNTPNEVASKFEKSIGKRILSLSMKRGHMKLPSKNTSGSKVKKSVSKSKLQTPGSIYKNKFGVAKKMPNFKSIHQRLFENMESIVENKQRTEERSEALIRSPAPRCAFLSPKIELNKDPTFAKKATMPSILSPLVRNCVVKPQTRVAAPRPAPGFSSVNRFGFRKPVKRLDSSVVKKKSNTDLTEIEDQERQILQGVRMNKRFLLQMKMREDKQ